MPVQTSNDDAARHPHHAIYASEAVGRLLLAPLALTVVRYRRDIHWSLC